MIETVAEGVANVYERLDRFREEVLKRFDALDHRVERLEAA